MEKVNEAPQMEEEATEIEYESDPERFDENEYMDGEDGDEFSQAPTETLAREYKLLMAQFD
jgi:hypothetical protein